MKYETYVDYRDRKGLKDHNISKMCSIPKSTFSGWKHGAYTPKTDKLVKIAKVLNIPKGLVIEPDSTKERRKMEHKQSERNDSG